MSAMSSCLPSARAAEQGCALTEETPSQPPPCLPDPSSGRESEDTSFSGAQCCRISVLSTLEGSGPASISTWSEIHTWATQAQLSPVTLHCLSALTTGPLNQNLLGMFTFPEEAQREPMSCESPTG